MPEQRNNKNILVQLLGTGIWTDLDDQMSQTEDTHFPFCFHCQNDPFPFHCFFCFSSILRSRCCMELKQLHWIGRHSEGCCFAWIKETTNVTLEGVPWLCPIANLGVILEVNRESSLRGYPLGVPPFCPSQWFHFCIMPPRMVNPFANSSSVLYAKAAWARSTLATSFTSTWRDNLIVIPAAKPLMLFNFCPEMTGHYFRDHHQLGWSLEAYSLGGGHRFHLDIWRWGSVYPESLDVKARIRKKLNPPTG